MVIENYFSYCERESEKESIENEIKKSGIYFISSLLISGLPFLGANLFGDTPQKYLDSAMYLFTVQTYLSMLGFTNNILKRRKGITILGKVTDKRLNDAYLNELDLEETQ